MKLRSTKLAETIHWLMRNDRFHLTVPDVDRLLDFDHPIFELTLSRVPPLDTDLAHEGTLPEGQRRGLPHAQRLAELLREGWEAPPVMILDNWVFDGKHRIFASRMVQRKTVRAIDLKEFASMDKPFFWRLS